MTGALSDSNVQILPQLLKAIIFSGREFATRTIIFLNAEYHGRGKEKGKSKECFSSELHVVQM